MARVGRYVLDPTMWGKLMVVWWWRRTEATWVGEGGVNAYFDNGLVVIHSNGRRARNKG